MINITEVSDLNENGLKAQKRLAQGNALGELNITRFCPFRAQCRW